MVRELLLVGAETPALRRVIPLLERADFRAHQVQRGDEAMALVHKLRYDLLLVRYPLLGAGLGELVRAVRGDGAPCRTAGFLLLAQPEDVSEVGGFLGRGIGRIVSLDAPAERLADAVADLLAVSPRRALRAVVELRAQVAGGGPPMLALTHDVSENGLLLVGAQGFPVGSRLRFELSLPGSPAPIEGEAEVVRHTDPARERALGAGARFLSFSGDSHANLLTYLGKSRRP